MNDREYDAFLHIQTTGDQQGYNRQFYYHRYEPTPYAHLEQLRSEYEISECDHVVDYGCGKGRLNFFLHYHTGATVTGVEMNDEFYELSLKNKAECVVKLRRRLGQIHFFHGLAEDYPVSPKDNRFYFFNPFSIHIFRNIIHRILQSVEQFPRAVDVILYYPSDDYREFLERNGLFELVQEIPCGTTNPYERFCIYRCVL